MKNAHFTCLKEKYGNNLFEIRFGFYRPSKSDEPMMMMVQNNSAKKTSIGIVWSWLLQIAHLLKFKQSLSIIFDAVSQQRRRKGNKTKL